MDKTTYLASKPRYEVLDGLRGVAALIVVCFHLFETYSPGPREQILNHGYLAVDFFFALSGFVVGYAYDDRWDRMTTWGFFKRRLVRLHPLLVLGTLIGAALFYFTDGSMFPNVAETPWWMMVAMTLLGCTMLPALLKWDIRGWQEMNSLNGATWSLFWEYIGNILYALIVRRFSKGVLALFVLLAAGLTVDVALGFNVFGLLGEARADDYNVIGGWSLNAEQCYIGMTRLLYPFFAGLLLSRIGGRIPTRRGFLWCSLLVAAVLCVPCVGPDSLPWVDGVYNIVIILFVFPLIVAMGAGSATTGRRTTALCKWLGDISYPLYITHLPLIYLHFTWAGNHPDAPLGTRIAVAVGVFFLAIGIAQASLKQYDEPVREWLKQHWLMGKKA